MDTDRYYDDCWCANTSGVYYCVNVEEWHSENTYVDDYTGERFYALDEDRIRIGSWDFMSEENANAFGFFKDESGHWERRRAS